MENSSLNNFIGSHYDIHSSIESNQSNEKLRFFSIKWKKTILIDQRRGIESIFGENIAGWMNHGGWSKNGGW